MKTFKLCICILLVGLIQSCKDFGDGNPLPACKWTYNIQSVSFQPVELNHPSRANELDYRFAYNLSYPIWCFSEIFSPEVPQKSKSQIKVTTTLTNCTGTTSRTNVFDYSNYADKVACSMLSGLDRPENGTPKVIMEIKSGPHENEWGEKGFVVWTKTFETCAGNPYVSQNGKMFATFIKNPTGMGSIGGTKGKTVIYRDGLMMEY